MREEYYLLKLNNARYINEEKEYNGCLKTIPTKAPGGKIIAFDKPFFMIATKEEDCFLDIISANKVVFDDTIISRGNFFVDDCYSKEKEYEYLRKINEIDEDTLSICDAEAFYILDHYSEVELTCYDYRKLSKDEVIREVLKLSDPLVVKKYMEELKRVISGEIAKENALIYLNSRKKILKQKEANKALYEMKYSRTFIKKHKRSKII